MPAPAKEAVRRAVNRAYSLVNFCERVSGVKREEVGGDRCAPRRLDPFVNTSLADASGAAVGDAPRAEAFMHSGHLAISGAGRTDVERLWDQRPFFVRAKELAYDALAGHEARREPAKAAEDAAERARDDLERHDEALISAKVVSWRDLQLKAAVMKLGHNADLGYADSDVERLLGEVLALDR
jgi:hypothetical protein